MSTNSKLKLNTTSLRNLSDSEMGAAAGGQAQVSHSWVACGQCPTNIPCITLNAMSGCPTGVPPR
jgi:hypothetical protein